MRDLLRPLIGFCVVLCVASTLSADIRLPKIFCDKMVLQRDANIRVWGDAGAGEELVISIGDNSSTTTADADGKWFVEVQAPPAGGPYELTVAGSESRVVFSDVMVGEVWLCSGQSNMQWSMRQSLPLEADEMEKFFAEINNPNVRLLTVPASAVEEPASDITNGVVWEECTPESVAEFSAVAYLFATALQKHEALRDVPIGLIDASWGGTPAEAWTSRAALEQHENLKPLLDHWDERSDKRTPHCPASLYNGMISPLVPFTIRGVIWYQGEANVGRGKQYGTLFPTLINDWRSRFQQEDLPFYYVQLAPFRYGDQDRRALAEVWDAQRKTLALNRTGMAGSSDIGDVNDIHPKNKDVVGDRLAKIALANLYGVEGQVWSGPQFVSAEPTEDETQLVVKFCHATGLKAGDNGLDGFQVCGEDGEFKPAKAEIRDATVVVWSTEVAKPVAVRYLWDDSSTASLFNDAGLPALPFRSDDFELISADQDF